MVALVLLVLVLIVLVLMVVLVLVLMVFALFHCYNPIYRCVFHVTASTCSSPVHISCVCLLLPVCLSVCLSVCNLTLFIPPI
jgi:hypothetical protein